MGVGALSEAGAELGRMLLERRRTENVAILGNHGLLVAANSVAEAEILLEEVCYKLRLVAASGAERLPIPHRMVISH